ncbi:MAG TPA: glycoside hydrolase family 28 protein [Acidobacteriaceae bacterium]|nr:glycoside hydrolase family 28 protein [Acidobacteriaceae bacterium]
MRMEDVARREFLKLAGFGIAGSAVGTSPQHGVATAMAGSFNVRSYGATGDGATLDTASVNKAIETAATAGGGTVYFPAGNYLCYSIHLKSHVTLYLDQGATILAADSPEEGSSSIGDRYDLAESNAPWESYQDYGHNHWHNSLLWGEGLTNVSIQGSGLIWGRGLSKGWGPGPKAEGPGVGNKSIALKNCRNVLLRDFSILKGGHFGILATGVDNLTIDNLIIDTDRDGMDIDCCRNVRVSNCTVNSPWDDGICPKSSYALGYARATEMVTITNCFVTGTYQLGTLLDGSFKKFGPDDHAYRTGRIKLGTESNGGFKNITISNCVFEGCQGLALETEDGALLEDVSITNITMRDISSAPIFFRLGSRMRGPKGVPVGQLRRIILNNIVCSNAYSKFGSILSGIPGHCIEDVQMSNIYIQHQGGGTVEQAAIQPPELESGYPDPKMFGPIPAQGFYLRHIRNLDMSHIEIAAMQPDHRPAFVLDDVQGADFLRIRTQQLPGSPVFDLHNVKDVHVDLSRGVTDTNIDEASHRTL